MYIQPAKTGPLMFLNLCLIMFFVVPSYGTGFPHEYNASRPVKYRVATSAVASRNLNSSTLAHSAAIGKNANLYVIKKGDNLFKILMREYGMTSRQAEKFIAIVRRENNISNFRQLRIGQKITISSLHRRISTNPEHVVGKAGNNNKNMLKQADQAPLHAQVLAIEIPALQVLQGPNITSNVKKVWGKIIPEQNVPDKNLSLNTERVSISIDPLKYPILTAMDGGRILVDAGGKITPTIKSVISSSDPALRIVSESAANPKRFLGALIEAGKFYSVAEDFVMEFGNDPKLTIRSDFKVERTAESMVNQDVILLNAGNVELSSKLKEFLKTEGFTVHEPFVLSKPHIYTPRNRLIQIASPAPLDIASSVLKALSITTEKNARIKIADFDNNGISISISPDLYFHYKGKTYCVRYLKDASVDNSLIPILAASGIHSIDINQYDDFRNVSERIVTSMGLAGTYGFHKLWPEEDAGYSLQMSGIMIDGAGASGESLFLTNREIDRIIRDISAENGVIVQN